MGDPRIASRGTGHAGGPSARWRCLFPFLVLLAAGLRAGDEQANDRSAIPSEPADVASRLARSDGASAPLSRDQFLRARRRSFPPRPEPRPVDRSGSPTSTTSVLGCAPRILAATTTHSIVGLRSSGGRVWSASSGGIARLDISGTGEPVETLVVPLFEGADVADGNARFAISASWTGPVRIADISDPAHPTVVVSEALPTPEWILPSVAAGTGFVALASDDGIRVWDTRGAQPVEARSLSGQVSIRAEGNLLHESGGGCWRLFDPLHPVLVRGGFTSSDTFDVEGAVGAYGRDEVVEIWEFSGMAPRLAVSLPLPVRVNAVEIDSGRLFVASADGALRRWDLSDPSNPAPSGQSNLWAETIAVVGARGVTPEAIFDASATPNPTIVSTFSEETISEIAPGSDIVITDDGTWDHRRNAYQVTDASVIRRLPPPPVPTNWLRISGAGRLFAFDDGNGSVFLVDYAKPDAPVLRAQFADRYFAGLTEDALLLSRKSAMVVELWRIPTTGDLWLAGTSPGRYFRGWRNLSDGGSIWARTSTAGEVSYVRIDPSDPAAPFPTSTVRNWIDVYGVSDGVAATFHGECITGFCWCSYGILDWSIPSYSIGLPGVLASCGSEPAIVSGLRFRVLETNGWLWESSLHLSRVGLPGVEESVASLGWFASPLSRLASHQNRTWLSIGGPELKIVDYSPCLAAPLVCSTIGQLAPSPTVCAEGESTVAAFAARTSDAGSCVDGFSYDWRVDGVSVGDSGSPTLILPSGLAGGLHTGQVTAACGSNPNCPPASAQWSFSVQTMPPEPIESLLLREINNYSIQLSITPPPGAGNFGIASGSSLPLPAPTSFGYWTTSVFLVDSYQPITYFSVASQNACGTTP